MILRHVVRGCAGTRRTPRAPSQCLAHSGAQQVPKGKFTIRVHSDYSMTSKQHPECPGSGRPCLAGISPASLGRGEEGRTPGETTIRGGAIRGFGAPGVDTHQYCMSLVALLGPSLQSSYIRLGSAILPACNADVPQCKRKVKEKISLRGPESGASRCLGEHGLLPPPTSALGCEHHKGPQVPGLGGL